MTEAEWLACGDPTRMLESLIGDASERKLRLLALAILTFGMAPDVNQEYRDRMEVAFRFADGEVTPEVLRRHWGLGGNTWPERPRQWALGLAVEDAAEDSLRATVIVDLLRDIFGNPSRLAIFSPEWRTDTAVAVARQMYESREFSAMPILADAVQDAGCENTDILNHCRCCDVHVRGCWVVDSVLGKE